MCKYNHLILIECLYIYNIGIYIILIQRTIVIVVIILVIVIVVIIIVIVIFLNELYIRVFAPRVSLHT